MTLYSFATFVAFLSVIYFLMIRPENKRRRKAEEMRSKLKKGDKITTIGGIVGTIVHVAEDTIVIETSEDRVRMEFAKWGVSALGVQVNPDPKAEEKKAEKTADAEDSSDK